MKTFWWPPQAATYASDVDWLFYFIYYTCVTFFLILMGAALCFVVTYRKRPGGVTTADIKGNHVLEIAWTMVPAAFMLIMFWCGFTIWIDRAVPPADSLEVRVTAQKWQWNYTYTHDGKSFTVGGYDTACLKQSSTTTRYVECSEPLRVPAGRPVKLIMNSVDVIHSFYIPDFRNKKDVLPGRYTVTWFEAPVPGEHNVFCTEYCGEKHGYMYSKVVVMPEEEFYEWLQTSADNVVEGTPSGEKLFAMNGCTGCHSVDGSRGVGPSLLGLYGRLEDLSDGTQILADENYIRESILQPATKIVAGYPPAMPSFQGRLSDEEVGNLIDYIKTLDTKK